jgi:large subunit ribosomal protein L21
MYAIVKVGGKQYRVEEGDSIVVDRLHEEQGAKLDLQPLLLADGDETVFEGADLDKVKVRATVAGHERGKKLRVVKFKPKKGYKRRTGHRSELTRLEIAEIGMGAQRRRSAKGSSAKGSAPKKEDGDGS